MNEAPQVNGTFGDMSAELKSAQRERLHALFPNISDADLAEVAEIFHGYCAIAWRIYERLKREQPKLIDELMRNRTMKAKVDSPQ